MMKKSSIFFVTAIIIFSSVFAILLVRPHETNQEPLSAYFSDMNGAASSYSSLDHSTLHNGDVSILTKPDFNRGTREVDGTWINVKPGDHIIFSAWIKTASYTSSNLYAGAEIGFDFYINSSQGYGIATIDSAGHQAGHPNDTEIADDYSSLTRGITYVPWGSDWKQVIWNLYVPPTYYSYVTTSQASVQLCNPVQICSMVPWFEVRDVTANAYSWFADPALYIVH